MAFKVTATKKRPQLFDELAGQEFVVSTLKSSLTKDRIAHAYLFSGPRGVGKTSAARILARAVNCQEGPTANPCGVCSSCQEIARGRSMDVIEIDGASNTSVNDIRQIRDEVLFAPNSSRYKVYIIDEVHMLSNSAFNALLKTIEEPPPYIIFIFATTEIHKVPATIRSRCQQFNFRLIAVEVIKSLLSNVCAEENIPAEDDALFWIAKEATGSMRDAFTLFDQVTAFSEGEITLEKIREKLGLVGLEQLNGLMEALASGKTSEVMTLVDSILYQGVAVEQFVGDLGEYIRNLLFMKHGVTNEALLGYKPDRFSSLAREAFTVDQLELAVEMVLKLYRDLRFSLNQRFELELLLSRIAGLGDYLSPRAMLGEIKNLKNQLARGLNPDTAAPETALSDRKEPAVDGPVKQEPLIRIERPSGSESSSTGTTASAGRPGGNYSISGDRPAEETSPAAPSSLSAQTAQGQKTSDEDDFDPDQYADQAPEEPDEEWSGADEPAEEAPLMDMGAFKAELMGELKRKKLTLSSALEKATAWQLDGDRLVIYFNNDFPARVVRQEQKVITEKINEMMGWNLKLLIKVEEAEMEESPLVDDQVQAVKKVFRGEVIQGGSGESL